MAKQRGALTGYPWTRFTDRRARSHACAVLDALAIAGGTAVSMVTAVDVLATWPSGRVLLAEPALSRIAGMIVLPAWMWLTVSLLMVFGDWKWARARDRRRGRLLAWRRPFPARQPFSVLLPAPVRIALTVAVVTAAFLTVLGMATGAKGSVRTLPGPTYQVSTCDAGSCAWSTVTPADYQRWEVRFLREDSGFALFGVLLVGGCSTLLGLHRFVGHLAGRQAGVLRFAGR